MPYALCPIFSLWHALADHNQQTETQTHMQMQANPHRSIDAGVGVTNKHTAIAELYKCICWSASFTGWTTDVGTETYLWQTKKLCCNGSQGDQELQPLIALRLTVLVRHPTRHITSHHITSHHITSHHITSHYITSHHITSHHITSHHITSHHITSHHITSHHITS